MLKLRLLPALCVLGTGAALALLQAQTKAPARPPITGVAHIALRTGDIAAARQFYGQVLGYQQAFRSKAASGAQALTYFKVNDHQYIELLPELAGPQQDRLLHIAFDTTDARKLRDYLASKGVKVPDKVQPDADGNLSFSIPEPEGERNLEFVQYMPGSLHSRNFGKDLPATRVSERMIHVGEIVKDRQAVDHLYRDILGFRLQWQGGMQDDHTDWVAMRVPDGADWIEYMLNVTNPSPRTRGVMNHLALGVPSIAEGYETVTARGMKAEKPLIGRDGKWQLNLYDPDLTRAELMEPKPVRTPCCSPIIEK
ncbi:MAG TPA: VOC family protein [Bryobacteraceae bacterium]